MPSSTMRLRRHEAVQYYAKRKRNGLADVNVYGAISDVQVGDVWKTRAEMSCSRVHRPVCPMIHQGPEGAYSILLAKKSRTTVDEGNLFIFKGPAEKVRDKILCRACPIVNCLRLSLSSGLPVRVIRSARLKSPYSPCKGFRYDGLYKVERRWGNKSNESFLFRRIIDENQPPLEILECLSPRIPSFVQRLKQLKMDRLGRGKKLLNKESGQGNFENKSVLGEEEEMTSFEEEQDYYEEERECTYDKENEDEINWTEIKREFVFVAEGGGNEIADIGKGEEEEEEAGETTLREEYEDVFEEEVVDVKVNNLLGTPASEEEILPTRESCEPPDRAQEERIFLLNDVTEISSVDDENEFQEENVPFKREFKNDPQMVEGYEERTVFVEDEEDPLLSSHYETNLPSKSPPSKEFVDIKPKKKFATPTNSTSKGDMNYNMYFVCPNVCRCRYNLSMRDVINIISGSGVCPCTWEKQPEHLEGEVALILKHLARHKSQIDECIQKGEHLDISGPNPNLAISSSQQLDSVILRLMFFLVNAPNDDEDVSDFVHGSGTKEKIYKKKHCLKNLRRKGVNVAARKLIFPKRSKKRHTKRKTKNLKVSLEETSDLVVKETISQKKSEVPFDEFSVDRLEDRSEEDPSRLDDLSKSNLSIVGTVSIGNNFNENVVWEKYDEMRLKHLEPSPRRNTPGAGISSTDRTELISLEKSAKDKRGRKSKLVNTSQKGASSGNAPRLESGTSNDEGSASWGSATPRRRRKKKSETIRAKSQSSRTQSYRISDHPQSHRVRSIDGVLQPKKRGRKKKTLDNDCLLKLRERRSCGYFEENSDYSDDESVRQTPRKRGRKKKYRNDETESFAENVYKTFDSQDQSLGMSSRVKEGWPLSVPKKKRGRKKKSIDSGIKMSEESTYSLLVPILQSPVTSPNPKKHKYLKRKSHGEDENVQLSYKEQGDNSEFRGFLSVGAVTRAKLNRLKCYLERKEPFHGFPPDKNYRGMGHLIALRLFLQKLRRLEKRTDRTMWVESGQTDIVSAS